MKSRSNIDLLTQNSKVKINAKQCQALVLTNLVIDKYGFVPNVLSQYHRVSKKNFYSLLARKNWRCPESNRDRNGTIHHNVTCYHYTTPPSENVLSYFVIQYNFRSLALRGPWKLLLGRHSANKRVNHVDPGHGEVMLKEGRRVRYR